MAMKKVKAGVKKVASKAKSVAKKVGHKITPSAKVTYKAPAPKTISNKVFQEQNKGKKQPAVRQPGFKQVGEKGYKPMTGKNLTKKKKKA